MASLVNFAGYAMASRFVFEECAIRTQSSPEVTHAHFRLHKA